MKKIICFLFATMLFASCTTTRFYSRDVYFLDFRPYAEKGFLMSTTTIGEKYQALGELNINCHSGYMKDTGKNWDDDVNMTITKNTKEHLWTIDEVLNDIYEEAKELGANGIINIRFSSYRNGEFVDFEISGLAVKLGS